MSRNRDDTYLEWVKLAEEAIERLDYESAARFFRHITAYFGLVDDASNQRKFAVKTGECYLNAAKKSAENDHLRAILLCIKASDSFQEGGREESVRDCASKIKEYYASITKDDFLKVQGNIHDFKGIGDYFVKNGDYEGAIECYRRLAERTREEEKFALSSGFYRDVGACQLMLKDFDGAAKSYATAAEMYFKCQEYFEAAWLYCESGFLFIYVGRLEDASIMARKASLACDEGRIDVLLNDLSDVCRLLSEKAVNKAQERWEKIRLKFKRSYIYLVDSSFQALRKTL